MSENAETDVFHRNQKAFERDPYKGAARQVAATRARLRVYAACKLLGNSRRVERLRGPVTIPSK